MKRKIWIGIGLIIIFIIIFLFVNHSAYLIYNKNIEGLTSTSTLKPTSTPTPIKIIGTNNSIDINGMNNDSNSPINKPLDNNNPNPNTKLLYNYLNLDTHYHLESDTVDQISTNFGVDFQSKKVKDMCGNMISIPSTMVQGSATYYEPGSFKFMGASYKPDYESSVYLSRSTGLSSASILPESQNEDIPNKCAKCKNDIGGCESMCNSLDKTQCVNGDCCVLLGGSKCVSGDKYGPSVRANYSDFTLENKDVYYYKNKCYGNCQTP